MGKGRVKFTMRISPVKERKLWGFNPSAKIIGDKRYNRRKEKEIVRRETGLKIS